MKQETMTTDEARRMGLLPTADAKRQDSKAGQIKLWLPKLPKATHPNSKSHFRPKAAATKTQREDAWITALRVMGLAKPWKAATVQITYHTSASRCDRDNVLAWCKASFDGLQGVVVDNDSAFTYLPVVIERVGRYHVRHGLIQLVITKTA